MKLTIAIALLITASSTLATAESWGSWRGPRADSICREENIPTNWAPAAASWKIELPGKGHASPIVWGDRVCTVTGLPASKERVLLCFDRATGQELWQQTVVQGPLEKLNDENSYASGTPATDGERVYAVFRVGDDIVVAAHDLATGKQLWLARPGTHAGEWGFSNEPVLFRDKVIVDGDGKSDSFLVALNRTDGKVAWRVKREHKGISYSAPLIGEFAGRTHAQSFGEPRWQPSMIAARQVAAGLLRSQDGAAATTTMDRGPHPPPHRPEDPPAAGDRDARQRRGRGW